MPFSCTCDFKRGRRYRFTIDTRRKSVVVASAKSNIWQSPLQRIPVHHQSTTTTTDPETTNIPFFSFRSNGCEWSVTAMFAGPYDDHPINTYKRDNLMMIQLKLIKSYQFPRFDSSPYPFIVTFRMGKHSEEECCALSPGKDILFEDLHDEESSSYTDNDCFSFELQIVRQFFPVWCPLPEVYCGFEELWHSSKYSDLEFVVKNDSEDSDSSESSDTEPTTVMRAHRAILHMREPEFLKILLNDQSETEDSGEDGEKETKEPLKKKARASSNTLQIEMPDDMDSTTLDLILEFIYIGNVHLARMDNESVVRLLKQSNKYACMNIKLRAEGELAFRFLFQRKEVVVRNFSKYLDIAEQYSCLVLKSLLMSWYECHIVHNKRLKKRIEEDCPQLHRELEEAHQERKPITEIYDGLSMRGESLDGPRKELEDRLESSTKSFDYWTYYDNWENEDDRSEHDSSDEDLMWRNESSEDPFSEDDTSEDEASEDGTSEDET